MEVDKLDPPGRGCTIQCPVYYISEVLHDAKTRYLEVHKLLYAVLIASRKLHHYFQAHKISVVTSYPLKIVLHNPNVTGNITKWAAELAEFELDFIAHHAIKSQVLTDFVADWTPPPRLLGEPDNSASEPPASVFTDPHWPSTSVASHVSRGPVQEPCSLLQLGNSSSTWCTWSSKQPTTWQSMRP
jgi:hypothetical protein